MQTYSIPSWRLQNPFVVANLLCGVSSFQAEKLVKQFDVDKDGMIDVKEFEALQLDHFATWHRAKSIRHSI